MNINENNLGKKDKSILVVDDQESIRLLVTSVLEQDYNIITRSDGQQALDYLKEGHPIDLILLDMEMPNMNGRTFVKMVKFNPHYGNIPIFFVTSVNSSLITNSFMRIGIEGFIFKPFKPEELRERIHSFFNAL